MHTFLNTTQFLNSIYFQTHIDHKRKSFCDEKILILKIWIKLLFQNRGSSYLKWIHRVHTLSTYPSIYLQTAQILRHVEFSNILENSKY